MYILVVTLAKEDSWYVCLDSWYTCLGFFCDSDFAYFCSYILGWSSARIERIKGKCFYVSFICKPDAPFLDRLAIVLGYFVLPSVDFRHCQWNGGLYTFLGIVVIVHSHWQR